MMTGTNVYRLAAAGTSDATVRWIEDLVTAADRDGGIHLREAGAARIAASCMVAPQPGDRVVLAVTAGGDVFVTQVLTRADPETARIAIPGARHVSMVQDTLTLTACEELRLLSARDMTVTAAGGTLRMSAQHLFLTVTRTLVENLCQHIAQVGSYALQVKDLLRMSARHALVTARKDLKMDAERIDLG